MCAARQTRWGLSHEVDLDVLAHRAVISVGVDRAGLDKDEKSASLLERGVSTVRTPRTEIPLRSRRSRSRISGSFRCVTHCEPRAKASGWSCHPYNRLLTRAARTMPFPIAP